MANNCCGENFPNGSHPGKLEQIPDYCKVLPTDLARKSAPNTLRDEPITGLIGEKPSKKGHRKANRSASRR